MIDAAKVRLSGSIGPVHGIPDADLPHFSEVSGRDDTLTLWGENANGKLLGAVVFGRDDLDGIRIYYARSMVAGIGPLMFRQLFGVAQVLGKPVAIHGERFAALRRVLGTVKGRIETDGDGVDMGLFDG